MQQLLSSLLLSLPLVPSAEEATADVTPHFHAVMVTAPRALAAVVKSFPCRRASAPSAEVSLTVAALISPVSVSLIEDLDSVSLMAFLASLAAVVLRVYLLSAESRAASAL